MVTVKVNLKARQHVRDLLSNYKTMEQEINEIRQSIMTPYQETDENYGGGKSSLPVFEVEEKAIKLATNKQIRFRSQVLAVIENVLANSSDHAQQIIELRYFTTDSKGEPLKLSWVKIAETVGGYSVDGCRKIEKAVCDRIAQQLGW